MKKKTFPLQFVDILQFHYAINQKQINEENNKHAVHGIQMPQDWFLAFVFARTNEKCNISFKRFAFILLLCNSVATKAIGKSGALLQKKISSAGTNLPHPCPAIA